MPIQAAFGRAASRRGAADAAILLFAMIETADGLANLDEIASTPGLDGLFVGPADLSLGMGLDTFADFTDPALLADARLRSSRQPATPRPHPWDPRAVATERRRDGGRGFRFVSCAVDEDLLREAAGSGPPRHAQRRRHPGRVSAMKLRSLFLLVAGVMIGLKVAAKLREDDPERAPRPPAHQERPSRRSGSCPRQVQRFTDAATGKSLDAIRRLRGEIRDRLGEDDAAAWN